MLRLLVALALIGAALAKSELAPNQLLEYLNEHKNPAGALTTSYGYPVTYQEANLGINRDSSLLLNHYIYESMSSFSLERIPPRTVHANGAGAKGYFEVTKDISHITSAKLFNTVGKKTPILIRFSPTSGEKGSPELRERNKGIAIKFYTEEGNMDLTAFNTNSLSIKNPSITPVFVHSFRPNPRTNLRDPTLTWDFIANHPEALHGGIQPLSLAGQPRSYKNMPGHAIHTYQVENDKDETSFVKFNWLPVAGIHNFTNAELSPLLGSQPDYHTRDLYDNIANETYPTWTFCVQVIKKKDIHKAKFDLFDVTMNWPEKDYPNIPIGKLVLNKNVDNDFAEVEQAAFNPGNLVPGIRGVDRMFEARTFLYRDSQIYRLGTGFNNIKTNCPLSPVMTYNRDGKPPLLDNGGDSPNYYPNSFHGIVPRNKTLAPLYRPNTDPKPKNYWQVADYFNGLSKYDQDALVANIGGSLRAVAELVQKKICKILYEVDKDFATRVEAVIHNKTASG